MFLQFKLSVFTFTESENVIFLFLTSPFNDDKVIVIIKFYVIFIYIKGGNDKQFKLKRTK